MHSCEQCGLLLTRSEIDNSLMDSCESADVVFKCSECSKPSRVYIELDDYMAQRLIDDSLALKQCERFD